MTATADALMAIFGFKRVEGNQMKTDRELLELAAKAAGIVGVWHERGQCIHVTDCEGMSDIWWRPLTDDGDALRLATKCMIYFGNDAETGRPKVAWHSSCGMLNSIVMALTDAPSLPIDINEWTRRAIVRAAAAIGEAAE